MLLCTETFLPVAAREARNAGLPDLALLALPAGLRELPEAERRALVARVVDQALQAVTRGPRA